MLSVEQAIAQEVPEALRRFLRESCGVDSGAFRPLAGAALPQPARRLLFHPNDMTSTLASFHGSPLHADVLQRQRLDQLYLREVFLRTKTEQVVEYGVIAIALEQFTAAQQAEIEAGRIPLGGLLHQAKIPFVSAPIGFFTVAAREIPHPVFGAAAGMACHGRFNRLAKPTGEPLAWILEVLPPAEPR
jgi:chorismate-pyruvate lyase